MLDSYNNDWPKQLETGQLARGTRANFLLTNPSKGSTK